jgi:hypothetical protein
MVSVLDDLRERGLPKSTDAEPVHRVRMAASNNTGPRILPMLGRLLRTWRSHYETVRPHSPWATRRPRYLKCGRLDTIAITLYGVGRPKGEGPLLLNGYIGRGVGNHGA